MNCVAKTVLTFSASTVKNMSMWKNYDSQNHSQPYSGFTAHHSAMCVAIFSVFFLSGFEKSVLFRGAPDHFHHLKPVQIRYPRPIIDRFRRLAAMLPDDPTAGHSSGDVSVGEIACLDQNVAYYEEVQGSF